MSKVNFVSEFNAIMRYARDNNLSLRERMLWIALFYIANDRAAYNSQSQDYEWPDELIQVSNGELNLYCALDKRGIETMRNSLKQRGLIDFQPGMKNKRNPAYRVLYLTSYDVGYKNVPNNAPNYVPNNDPKHVPNHDPNDVPNPIPSNAPKNGVLGTNLYPSMPPYSKYKSTNQTTDREGEEQTDPPSSPVSFSPPTVDEVLDYCREVGIVVDAHSFVDFYASNGWMVGKNPMQDWKSALRRWVRRDKKEMRGHLTGDIMQRYTPDERQAAYAAAMVNLDEYEGLGRDESAS